MSKEHLTPFPKGVSGNPAGRPPGIPNSKTRLRRLLELTERVKNPVTGELEDFTIMEQIDMRLVSKARNGDLKAINTLLDRLEGKPAQAIENSGEQKIIIETRRLDNGGNNDDNKD